MLNKLYYQKKKIKMSLRINPNSVEHWKAFNKCCFLSLPPVGTLKKKSNFYLQ